MTLGEFKQKVSSKLINEKDYCIFGEGKRKNCLCVDDNNGKYAVYYKFGMQTYDEMFFETEDAALDEAFRRLTTDTRRAQALRTRKNSLTGVAIIAVIVAVVVLAAFIPVKPAVSLNFGDYVDGFYTKGTDESTAVICQYGIDFRGPKWYVCTKNGDFVETIIVEGEYPKRFCYDILMQVNPENQYHFQGYFNGTKKGSDGETYRVFHVEKWSPVYPVSRGFDVLTTAGITIYDMFVTEYLGNPN